MRERISRFLLMTGLAILMGGIPPAFAAGEGARALGRVFVRSFNFVGNTVFSDDELSLAVSEFAGRKISPSELEQARRKITAYYIDRGYVNSGAVVENQKISAGKVRIRIEEGRLTGIRVGGNGHLRSAYVERRIQRAVNEKKPLNYQDLLERLRLLKDDPLIENIHAEIKPGLHRGEASLDVEIKEARPYRLSLITDNHRSPSVGSTRGIVRFSHINLTGWGDSIFLDYGLARGLSEYSGRYSVPVTRWDTRIGAYAERYASDIVTAPFNSLDITSETTRYGGFVRQPVFKTSNRELVLELGIQHTVSKVKLAGEAFSFSPHEAGDRGVYRVSPLRFSQEYVDRGVHHVFALHSTFSYGLDIRDATIDVDKNIFGRDAPTAKYFAWLGQAQFLWKPRDLWNSQFLLRARAQLTPDPLLPSEQFGLGGYTTVRGYRENVMTTDNGVNASVEWQLPVWEQSVGWWKEKPENLVIHLVPFIDWGQGWNRGEKPDPDPESIWSLGLGLKATWGDTLRAAVYWGKALRDVPEASEHDIQDDGIHFSVQLNLF